MLAPLHFAHQRGESRNIVVPFDQGWRETLPGEGVTVEIPHRVGDGLTVIVD
jgi:hypothetical protein